MILVRFLDLRYDEARTFDGKCRDRDAGRDGRIWRTGMLSRALGLATVMVVMSSLAAERALAQAQNLEAGKSPSQIFAGTCTVCHKSPRGLLKTVAPGSLPGFLRQHYTTSSDMAGVLASFLISNGATDARFAGTQQKGTKEGVKEGTKETSRESTRDAPPDQLEHVSHRQRPGAASPQESQDTRHASRPDADTQPPSQALSERGPEGRKMSAKQKLSRRGKPGDELPKTEPAGGDAAKTEPVKPEGDRPTGEGQSESAKVEPAKEPGETSALRADPVPPVTPAPLPAASAAASSSGSETPAMSFAAPTPAPALTISAPPPLPPVAPAGPPAPPISQ
jgi:hypothetical protein